MENRPKIYAIYSIILGSHDELGDTPIFAGCDKGLVEKIAKKFCEENDRKCVIKEYSEI